MTWADALPSSAYSLAVGSSSEIDSAAVQLRRIREDYHVNGTVLAGARHRIIHSWNRCRHLGVNPDKTKATISFDVDALREANEELLRAAGPVLERLTQVLTDTGYVVVLTDALGRLITISGNRGARARVGDLGFAPGADCSEGAAGTNAIGTVIADRRPLQLVAAEHFCEAGQQLTCTAAPIYLSKTREIAGVLDITGHYRLVRSHLIDIVTLGALEVEERLAATVHS
jgi:sigma-54 dependent transcriptional regulator, acetoin dehydrogenase operon transcriptional activator AcoR